jgi:hypothetical protein
VLAAVALAAIGFGLATAYFLLPPLEYRLAPFNDQEYIARAERTEQAVTLLAKYPAARRTVDRSGAVIVDFSVERGDRYLRLRVIMDSFANRPLDTFADCSGLVIREGVTEYLQTERCLEPD